MGALRGNSIPDAGNDVIIPESVAELRESVPSMIRQTGKCRTPTAYSTVAMRNSRVSILAAVDERGYLVPILTATDLLLELKALWKAAQD